MQVREGARARARPLADSSTCWPPGERALESHIDSAAPQGYVQPRIMVNCATVKRLAGCFADFFRHHSNLSARNSSQMMRCATRYQAHHRRHDAQLQVSVKVSPQTTRCANRASVSTSTTALHAPHVYQQPWRSSQSDCLMSRRASQCRRIRQRGYLWRSRPLHTKQKANVAPRP